MGGLARCLLAALALAQGRQDPPSAETVDRQEQVELDQVAEHEKKGDAQRVADFLYSGREAVLAAALEALGRLKARPYAPKAAGFLTYRSQRVEAAAIDSLSGMEAAEYADKIVESLTSSSPEVLAAACRALGRLKAVKHVGPIARLALVEASDLENDRNAREAGRKEEAEEWVKTGRERTRGVRFASLDAVGRLCGVFSNRGFKWVRTENRITACFEQEADEYVARAAGSSDPATRAAAIRVLAQIGADKRLPVIAEGLEAGDADTQRAAIDALAQLQAGQHLPAVAEFLEASDLRLRVSAIDAVAELGGAEYAPKIQASVGHPEEWVHLSACAALEKLGARELMEGCR